MRKKASKSSQSSSTGPSSLPGKQRSSRNAIKLGLFSRKWLSLHEHEHYEDIFHYLRNEHQPQTETENLLIQRLAISMTRLERLVAIEDAQYALARKNAEIQATQTYTPENQKLSNLSPKEIEKYHLLRREAALPDLAYLEAINRQQNALHRQIAKELGEVITLISMRKEREKESPPKEIPPSFEEYLEMDSPSPED